MSALLLAAVLAWSGPAVVSPTEPARIYSQAKYDVEGDLEHIATDPVTCRLRFLNRNTFAIRVDFRVTPRNGEPGAISSVILRSRGGGSRREQQDWDRAQVVFAPGVDYTAFEIVGAVRGTVTERFGTRVSSTGISEQYTELEFTEGLGDQGRITTPRLPR
jgi:hypothetical protein